LFHRTAHTGPFFIAYYAVAGGRNDARKKRDSIKRDLTPSQLEKGQVMAREISERIEERKAAEGE
jgi:hypothetical protein